MLKCKSFNIGASKRIFKIGKILNFDIKNLSSEESKFVPA